MHRKPPSSGEWAHGGAHEFQASPNNKRSAHNPLAEEIVRATSFGRAQQGRDLQDLPNIVDDTALAEALRWLLAALHNEEKETDAYHEESKWHGGRHERTDADA